MTVKTDQRLESFRKAGVELLDELPEGFARVKGTMTQPFGWYWASNGAFYERGPDGRLRPRPGYGSVLVREPWNRPRGGDAG